MNQNIIFSLITIIFSSFFLFFSLQLPASKTSEPIGPGGWPNFILSLMFILGIILLIRSIAESKKKKSEITNKENELANETGKGSQNKRIKFLTRHWFVVVLLVLYFILLPLLGFFVSTFILILLLTWLFGMKRKIYIFITSLFSSLAFSYIFVTLFTLPLPRGVSIFHEISLFFQ